MDGGDNHERLRDERQAWSAERRIAHGSLRTTACHSPLRRRLGTFFSEVTRAPSEGKVADGKASYPQRLQSNEIETLE